MAGSGRTLQAQKESSMMKQEMRGQKAFQNKMRALKQIELNKYGGKEQIRYQPASNEMDEQLHHHGEDVTARAPAGAPASIGGAAHPHDEEQNADHTGGYPLGNHPSDEAFQELIWNPEDDDQIFDFLMDDG